MKIFIFDFDGTLADSFEAIWGICNDLAGEFGYPSLSLEQSERLRNLTARELMRLAGISPFQLPRLVLRLRQELQNRMVTLHPFPELPAVLVALRQQGCRLGIVTSNDPANVRRMLAAHELEEVFEFVESGLTVFGKGRILRRVIHQYGLEPATTAYVGDETRDIEAARSVGLYTVAVAWGFNTASVLAEFQPDFLIQQPQELLQIAHNA